MALNINQIALLQRPLGSRATCRSALSASPSILARSSPRNSNQQPDMKSLGAAPSQQLRPVNSGAIPEPSVSPYSAPQQPFLRSYRVPLFDALKFNGPAPELINARLAMVGFLCAASNEAQTGKLIAEQLQESPWFPLAFCALFIYASLVPITKGAKRESFGWFTPRAELTNGRTAMLAFAVLLGLEFKSGVPFF